MVHQSGNKVSSYFDSRYRFDDPLVIKNIEKFFGTIAAPHMIRNLMGNRTFQPIYPNNEFYVVDKIGFDILLCFQKNPFHRQMLDTLGNEVLYIFNPIIVYDQTLGYEIRYNLEHIISPKMLNNEHLIHLMDTTKIFIYKIVAN